MHNPSWGSLHGSNVTLYSYRRFKTSHLLNLRFLEEEIEQVDREIYQADLKLGVPDSKVDRLLLKHNMRDAGEKSPDAISNKLILRLRDSGGCSANEALAGFNHLMNMQTCALSDYPWHVRFRHQFNKEEASQTGLVRVDLPLGRPRSPIEIELMALIRAFHQRRHEKSDISAIDVEALSPHKDTTLVVQSPTRFGITLLTAWFLVVPLCILSAQKSKGAKLVTIVIFIVLFCFLVSFLSRTSSHMAMAASAGYAAVLAVFISKNP
ncbi:hypothetical protein K469DRAFT_726137 [Zopfia rhizophila CBS 207.26]|uniref:DUF6594 domain-containing protein n=1 Tax=Zopfia rhizophila CBS 207.26 TaxID=1314779 RepID=A0A6A6E3Y2_9PEZI|nr:hypothetical protein K469DRAFT_726137 [Zopfia rhizophila CBS 207.26]